jgi:hypothetical protein
MQGLFGYFGEQVEKILNYAIKLKETVDGIYQNFHENFGLAKLSPPPLTLARHLEAMHDLQENASRFCHDPINIATYRDFMVKKFYNGLVEEARQQFELTRLDTEHWLRGALGPLNGQIMERQNLMLKRVENLRNLKNNLTTVQERLKQFDQQRISLKKQGDQLDQLRADLADSPNRPAPAASTKVTPVSSYGNGGLPRVARFALPNRAYGHNYRIRRIPPGPCGTAFAFAFIQT